MIGATQDLQPGNSVFEPALYIDHAVFGFKVLRPGVEKDRSLFKKFSFRVHCSQRDCASRGKSTSGTCKTVVERVNEGIGNGDRYMVEGKVEYFRYHLADAAALASA
ncbi:MAG: hypothetical protein A4E64_00490 [Syntrophorhabdus sp. PtaU1.Bin058]|nr:MAG: hypothetical protein A4E64_00490 [Syntrophorhabdus sp. PtaU1.Bin058]